MYPEPETGTEYKDKPWARGFTLGHAIESE
jgi:hypothetical protein